MSDHSHLHMQDGDLVAAPCNDEDCPMRWCSHPPDRRCLDCASDGDVLSAIPPFGEMS